MPRSRPGSCGHVIIPLGNPHHGRTRDMRNAATGLFQSPRRERDVPPTHAALLHTHTHGLSLTRYQRALAPRSTSLPLWAPTTIP